MGSSSELYNSNYCRLCGEDSQQSGIFIFEGNSISDNISTAINKYLPVKVVDDGKLPRIICSNCHNQLHATITFFDLLSEGQQKLSKLFLSNVFSSDLESSISTDKNVIHPLPPLERENKKPAKRGRGRPRKVFVPDEVAEKEQPPLSDDLESVEDTGKSRRKRKLPCRFNSSIQGKELEKVLREVGLPEEEDKLIDSSTDPQVIGKLETSSGENLGEVMVQLTDEEANRQQMKYRCEVCSKVFSQELKFLDHECINAKQSNTISQQNITTPISEVDPVAPDTEKAQLENKDDSPYECDICQKKFKYSSSVAYHKETEHNDGRRYVCNKCPRSFKHRQLLRNHQHVHSSVRSFHCDICGANFKTKGNLINHAVLHTGRKKYFCEFCGQLFAHKTSLTLHLRMHNGEKPFECEVCQKRFTQKGNLLEHMRIHTGEKPFECHICNRKFTTSSQCKLHLKRHSGEKPWYCEICGKSFLNKATWKCHLRRHKGENPYDCNVCGRDFAEYWALKKHIRTHTGEKPYKCTICEKTFSDCSNLTKHKKIHAKDKVGVEETETEQIIFLSYPDPLNPNAEVSERLIVENKPEEGGTEEEVLMQVMDEMGNPLKFTFQDGTQLQVTTRDGKSLEVRTPEGQAIPVRLITDGGEPIHPDLTPIVVPTIGENYVDINNLELVTTEEEGQTITLQGFIQIA